VQDRKRTVAAYEAAKAVHEQRMAAIDGVRSLEAQVGMNPNSARYFFYVYRKMREGRVYHRGLGVDATAYFLDRIRGEAGDDAHGAAMQSVWLHVAYYEEKANTHMHSMRRMLEEQSLATRNVPAQPAHSVDKEEVLDYKVARLCWNTKGWQEPSGRHGKLDNPESFEGEHGFGHEEWLFDHGRLIDGWKYGFIQALNRSFDSYSGKTISLLLYTIENKKRNRYWVGSITGVEVLTEQQALQVSRLFVENGWLDEMREQLSLCDIDGKKLNASDSHRLFNLRYRPERCSPFDPMIEFPAEDLPATYYGTFQKVPLKQVSVLNGANDAEALRSRNIDKLSSTRTTREHVRVIDLVHKRWQKELGKSLREQLPGAEVTVETKVGGYWVDIVIDMGGKRILVELKTCTLVRQAIREALSQLLEYAYWPPASPRGDVLLIVCAGREDEADREYMRMLRERFGMPVHYLQYREGVIVGIQHFVAQLTA